MRRFGARHEPSFQTEKTHQKNGRWDFALALSNEPPCRIHGKSHLQHLSNEPMRSDRILPLKAHQFVKQIAKRVPGLFQGQQQC